MGSQQVQNVVVVVVCVVLGFGLAVAAGTQSVDAGGVPVFVWAAAIAFVLNWVVFVPSFLARTEHYFDLTGSITYLLVTWMSVVLVDRYDGRSVLVAVLVTIWAGRLGTFLFRRVRSVGEDGRFDKIKQSLSRFLMTWTLQGLWVTLTLCAAIAVISTDDPADLDAMAAVGLVLWIVGFSIEALADLQKSRFRADPANAGRFITTGLWSWSRHPNYFGEILLWVGIAVIALPVLDGLAWLVLVSPVFVFVLLTRISGIPLLAARGKKRWGDDPDYQQYLRQTSLLIPRPPRAAD